jgi:uncharacterized protein YndB with AHSA1/START domain
VRIAGSQEVIIAADPVQVWGMISDVTRTPEWSPDVIRSAWIKPWEGPAVGAAFESLNRMPLVGRWRSRSTVTEAEPGRRFAFAVGANADDPNTMWTWDLEPTPEGVRVRLSYDMRHEPWIVLTYYRLTNRADRVRRSVRCTLDRLKAAAEQ